MLHRGELRIMGHYARNILKVWRLQITGRRTYEIDGAASEVVRAQDSRGVEARGRRTAK